MNRSIRTTKERFNSHIKIHETGCWLWTANVTIGGYGRFKDKDFKSVLAHRFAYEQFIGEIPEGLQLDHLCRVRHCVNPYHLEAVTPQENTRRGLTGILNNRNSQKMYCPYKHPYSTENTLVTKQGWRKCRICIKISNDKRF